MTQSPPLAPVFLSRPLAHRGYHDATSGRPENSRAAMEAAIRAGYGMELDVQPSSDGGAMVFHDDTLDRMTETSGPVQARSSHALSQIALGQSDERIPTLAEVLQQVAGRAPLLIELKDQAEFGGTTANLALAKAVARDLAAYQGPVALMSFNPEIVAQLGPLLPNTPRGLTTDSYRPEDRPEEHSAADWQALHDMAGLAPSGAAFISHAADDLARALVQSLRTNGLPVLCWTIRSPEAEAAARRLADNITFEGYAAPLSDLDPDRIRPT